MQAALRFLTLDDHRLLLEQAERCTYARNTTILEEGSHRTALFFIERGAARVERTHFGRGVSIARIGSGDVFGELSFLESTAASASVVADEDDTEVAVLDGSRVYSLLASVPGLAARFYQSLATVLSHRLRDTTALLPPLLIEDVPQVNRFHAPRTSTYAHMALPPSLVEAIDAFKTEMMLVERGILTRKVGDEDAQSRVSAACEALSAALRTHVEREQQLEDAIGAYVFRETFSILMRSTNVDRWFTKPRGYAGDFYSIELIYQNMQEGEGRLGRFVDRWALDLSAAKAVRNRRGLLASAIREVAARNLDDGPTRVTSLASGPAREIFDVLEAPDAPLLHATCIDIDSEALGFAAQRAGELGVEDRITFARDNVLRLSRGRGKTTLPPQHLIYSIGLIDYLEDEHVVKLLDWVHDQLVPGGTVVVGNFVVGNPDKAVMDHVFEWRLNHRTPEDLQRLFGESKFLDTPVDVRREEERINLFAFATKSGVASLPARQTGAMAAADV